MGVVRLSIRRVCNKVMNVQKLTELRLTDALTAEKMKVQELDLGYRDGRDKMANSLEDLTPGCQNETVADASRRLNLSIDNRCQIYC